MSQHGKGAEPKGLTASDIAALMQQFEASDWSSMHLRIGDSELYLDRNAGAAGLEAGNSGAAAAAPQAAAPVAKAPAPAPSATAAPAAEEAVADNVVVVRAPNLGTFYRSPKPGAPAYVEIGQRVEADTEVCLIEVMKLFTPVVAGVAGVVRKVLVEDADMVEHGQALFHIERGD